MDAFQIDRNKQVMKRKKKQKTGHRLKYMNDVKVLQIY